jgi:hypothetical protein
VHEAASSFETHRFAMLLGMRRRNGSTPGFPLSSQTERSIDSGGMNQNHKQDQGFAGVHRLLAN